MVSNRFRLTGRTHSSGNGETDTSDQRVSQLVSLLKYGDREQLAFQISEIAGTRIYEQSGIEIRPGDTVVDAGGNFGVSAAHFALQCDAGAVHSLEPVPQTFEILRRNVERIPNCFVHPQGLGSTAETVNITHFPGADSVMSGRDVDPARIRKLLSIAGENLGMSSGEAEEMARNRLAPQTVECRLTTLSSLMRAEGIESVDLLKIDVEGAEVDVLEGIASEDWPRIRQISAEIHSEQLLERFQALLADHSYKVTVEQDPQLSGTPIRLVYATR